MDVQQNRIAARLKIVEQHVERENRHDLEAVMGTFGETACYDDEPFGAHYVGQNQVRAYYASLFSAMPDVNIDVRTTHSAEAAIILEVVISGHHRATWRGLPATGRRVCFPLCGIFTFDDFDRLSGEKIYYDRATVLSQLGIFHEPEWLSGRLNTILMHPATMLRIVSRKLFGR